MVTLTFFDIDENRIRELQHALDELPSRPCEYRFLHVQSFDGLLQMGLNLDAVVSPSNCLMFFNGGVDGAYLKSFPNIQRDAQAAIKYFGPKTALGRSFLPVGSAIRIGTGCEQCPSVIATPTMFFPEDIRGTENVRHAFWAALKIMLGAGFTNVAVPCMGMGYGRLSARECAREIDAAFDIPFRDDDDLVSHRRGWWYVRNDMACRQPHTYANTEVQSPHDDKMYVVHA